MFFYVSLETLPFYTPYPSILLEEAPPKNNNIKVVVLISLFLVGGGLAGVWSDLRLECSE